MSQRSKTARSPQPASCRPFRPPRPAQANIVLRASGTGTLIAATESSLGFKTSGTLTTLNVKVGSQVKAGDLIAQLDSSNQTLALAQAQQALNQLTSASAHRDCPASRRHRQDQPGQCPVCPQRRSGRRYQFQPGGPLTMPMLPWRWHRPN